MKIRRISLEINNRLIEISFDENGELQKHCNIFRKLPHNLWEIFYTQSIESLPIDDKDQIESFVSNLEDFMSHCPF